MIEFKLRRNALFFRLVLTFISILASSYFLYATDTFPEIEVQLFATIANIILFYFVFWPTLGRLMKDAPVLTADDSKLRYEQHNNWMEVMWGDIKSLEFTKGYDGYRISKKLIIGTREGKAITRDLTHLDVEWGDLQSTLNSFNRK